ncbi:MAG: DUF4389 domain-containing protein [Chlorobi bacterium]|nr:DUF4389 domain-containing protein [Chlorobiota bacterium]
MKLTIKHQESFSRGELLLRTFFGWIYILIPHGFILAFLGIWSCILTFISFWAILFTGKYPKSFFEYQVNLQKWALRVNSRMYNLADGYPAFGLKANDEHTDLEIPYPENLNRGMVLVKFFFGAIYVIIPHLFLLFFKAIAVCVIAFLAWWVVLFTGNYPKSWHAFNVRLFRWQTRINLYLTFMTDEYPPFNGKE